MVLFGRHPEFREVCGFERSVIESLDIPDSVAMIVGVSEAAESQFRPGAETHCNERRRAASGFREFRGSNAEMVMG
jgi:hypothetical protein